MSAGLSRLLGLGEDSLAVPPGKLLDALKKVFFFLVWSSEPGVLLGKSEQPGVQNATQGPGCWNKRRGGWGGVPSPQGAVDAVPYPGHLGCPLPVGWLFSIFLGRAQTLPWGLVRVGLLVRERMKEGAGRNLKESERDAQPWRMWLRALGRNWGALGS